MSEAAPQWGTKRRLGVATNVSIQVTLLIVCVIGLNWVSSRRYKRWDLTDQAVYKLSEGTIQVIDRIAENEDKTTILIWYAPDEHGAWEEALQRTSDLLEEYKTRSHGKLSYEVVQVYVGGRDEIVRKRKQYDIRTEEIQPNDVLFKHGDIERAVNLTEFFVQDWSTVVRHGDRPRLSAFNGEEIVTSTLQAIIQKKPIRLGFTEGHEEIPISETQPAGYARFVSQILVKREGYDVTPVRIDGPNGVPKDIDVLVVLSPRRDFTETDARNVKIFLNSGGRALFLLDSYIELEHGKLPVFHGLLRDYGIMPGTDVIFEDEAFALNLEVERRRTQDPTIFRAAQFDDNHPVTAKFDEEKEVNFVLCSSVGIDPTKVPEGLKGMEIVKSSTHSWAETTVDQKKNEFTPGKDLEGPVPIGVAVEGLAKGQTEKKTRIVAIGDATALTNFIFGQGIARPDLVLNAIRWLADQEHLIRVDPKRPEDRSLHMTKAQEGYVFRVAVFFLPMVAIAFGATMWMSRRSQ